MKRTLTIAALILAVVVLGSFQLNIKAEDIGTLHDASQGSFAETAPAIPGYSASYPATAEMATGPAIAKPSYAAEGSFAATPPQIPGYNAEYPFWAASQIADRAPTLAKVMAPSSYGPSEGFAVTVPRIPGYNVEYPLLSLIVMQN